MSGEGPNDSQAPNNVSGASVFWALTSIALNAMTQPSFCGALWRADDIETPLWLYRSSPTVCALDAVAEVWIMVDKSRGSRAKYDNSAARPTDVVIRLAIFLFAVLPQAIKLFSIQGIWVTQVIAALFLASSLVSMARGLCLATPQDDLLRLVGRLQKRDHAGLAQIAMVCFGWIPYAVLLNFVCYMLSGKLKFHVSEQTANIATWADTIAEYIIGAYLVQVGVFLIISFKSPVPRLPILMIAYLTNRFGIRDMLKGPGAPVGCNASYWHGSILLFDILLCSQLTTSLMHRLARALVRRFSQADLSGESEALQLEWRQRDSESRPSFGDPAPPPSPTGAENQNYLLEDSAYHRKSAIAHGARPGPQETTDIEQADIEAAVETGHSAVELPVTCSRLPSTPDATSGTVEPHGPPSDTGRDDEGSLSSQSQTPEQDDVKLSWFVEVIAVPIGIAILLTSILFRALWRFGEDKVDEEAVEESGQSVAERGEATVSGQSAERGGSVVSGQSAAERGGPADPSQTPTAAGNTIALLRRNIVLWIKWVLWMVLRGIALLVVRSLLWWYSLQEHAREWFAYMVTGHSTGSLLVCFTVSNFTVAIVYYLVYFDGTGLSVPNWAQFFG